MFQIQSRQEEGQTFIDLLGPKAIIQCTINATQGANLSSFSILWEGQKIQLIDGYQKPKEFVHNEGFKSSKLIPFPNRINKGKYRFNDQAYQLDINFPIQGHAIHGLIFNSAYQIIRQEANATQAMLELQTDYPGSSAFPFPFLCSQTFTLNADGLTIKTRVANIGLETMPFGDGWHPYFCFAYTAVNDYTLRIPKVQKIEVDELMIPTGALSDFTDFTEESFIHDVAFDTGFLVDVSEGSVATILKHAPSGLGISVWQDENYP
ncbi:MAG: aldose 1-epimerase [Bacteroidota bacterium]